jgi:hypothetical protein
MSKAIISVLAFLFAVTLFSCTGNSIKTDLTEDGISDYSGVYKLEDTKICNLVITIKKNKSGYSYMIDGADMKSSGLLSVEKGSGQTYLRFNGTLRDGDKTAVEGSYSGRTITIQNYGNSMSQYICFKKCDAKFLEFLKAE